MPATPRGAELALGARSNPFLLDDARDLDGALEMPLAR